MINKLLPCHAISRTDIFFTVTITKKKIQQVLNNFHENCPIWRVSMEQNHCRLWCIVLENVASKWFDKSLSHVKIDIIQRLLLEYHPV